MATHAPMARVPFAPLDSPRLQHLASAKNRQNGILAQKSTPSGKANVSVSKTLSSPSKRPFEPTELDEYDSENVDPAVLFSPSKKSKVDGCEKPVKPFTFSLAPSNSMPPPPTILSRLSTPARANMSSPRAPMTAPAGRSPKRKIAGISKNRRVSAPFTRVDPPFASRSTSSLPFSLDAALSGTFSTPAPKSAGATLQESMPKNWFFDIYEDTPEEHAATLMEHSTLTLDLSSDEESRKKEKDERGKENMPPDDYDAPQASRAVGESTSAAPVHVKKADILRRKILAVDDMDDGQRSALADLETEDFIPVGLSKDSYVIVNAASESSAVSSTKPDLSGLFATPVAYTAPSEKKSNISTPSKSLYDMSVVSAEGVLKGDIIVWEDSPSAGCSTEPIAQQEAQSTLTKGAVADENAPPSEDAVTS